MFLVWLSVKYWMQPATAHLNRLASEHDPCQIYWHASTPMEKAVVNQLRCFFTEIWVSTVIHNYSLWFDIEKTIDTFQIIVKVFSTNPQAFPKHGKEYGSMWICHTLSQNHKLPKPFPQQWKFIFTRLWKLLAGYGHKHSMDFLVRVDTMSTFT